MVDHQAHDERIVQIDPVRHLLGPAVGTDRQSGQPRDIVLEHSAIGRLDLAVGHPMHAVRPDPEIADEEGIPFVVVDLQDRGGIVGEPSLPQLGARRRLGAGASEAHEETEDREQNGTHSCHAVRAGNPSSRGCA